MATAKNYINLELDFLEKRLDDLRNYLSDNPADQVTDRTDKKLVKGEMIKYIVQTKENILKCVRDSMKDYATLLEQINNLREVEEKKLEARGGGDIPQLAKKFINKK